MKSFFDPVKERAKAGEFMVPGGYQILKEAIETVEKNYQMTRNTEEMGPQFSAVLILFQQDEVGAPIIFLQLEAAGKEHVIDPPP